MAVGVVEERCTRRRGRKTQNSCDKRKLLLDEKVEVRSSDEGFQGSWHPGTVVECEKKGCRRVMYDHILLDDLSGNLVELIHVTPTIEGARHSPTSPSYRGFIRPSPPPLEVKEWTLHYGLCVDVYHNDGWWEGVIFDHNDGSEQRKVFFPDLGDELDSKVDKLRITQVWDEQTEVWKIRGRWLFLELIEEYERDCCRNVSIKQIWYDVREKCDFKKIKEWTCTSRAIWEKLTLEAVIDNLRITIAWILQESSFSGSIEENSQLQVPNHDLDINMHEEGVIVSFGNGKSLLTLPSCSDEVTRITFTVKRENCSSDETSPQRKSSASKKSWLPAGTDIVPGPEYCPDAIAKYASSIHSKERQSPLLKDVRKHLLYVGWSIDSCKDDGQLRIRYTSPNGKRFLSLPKACLERTNPSSNAQDAPNGNLLALPFDESNPDYNCAPSLISSDSDSDSDFNSKAVVPKYCPEAVVQWYEVDPDEGRHNRAKYNNLILKAKRHLCYLGWETKRTKVGQKEIWAYRAPGGGRLYTSLRKACEGCIKAGGVSLNSGSANGPIESSFVSSELKTIKLGKGIKRRKFRTKGMYKKKPALASRKLKNLKVRKSCRVVKDKIQPSRPTRVLRSTIRVHQQQPVAPSRNPRTVLSWLMENNVILPRDKVYYCSKKDNSRMKEGMITRDGIKCTCCLQTYPVSHFEAHAGGTYHRPTSYTFLEDGRTLHDCENQIRNKNRIVEADSHDTVNGTWHNGENDNICSICHYGGELLLCDQCPSSFHKDCLGLQDIPDGDWFCPSCCCKICDGRTLKKDETHTVDDRVFSCYQCELKYHAKCLETNRNPVELGNCSTVNWFCNKRCEEIYLGLKELLGRPIPVGSDNLTWTLRKSSEYDNNPEVDDSDTEASTENYSKLYVALGVMHECFDTVKDTFGRDLVKDIIFNRWSQLNRLNFRGFYTVHVEKDDELITVATVRIFGGKVAEVPLVATRFDYRQRGMCRVLMNELEKRLVELGVERLVLPAVPSMVDTWTKSFGFSLMTPSERLQFVHHTFLDFQGTVACQKYLSKIPSQEENHLCRGADGSDNPINLDGSNVVPETFQAGQLEEIPTIDQGELQNAVGGGNSSSEGQNHPVVTENVDSNIVLESSSPGVNANHKERSNTYNQCYKRRKISPT